MRTLVAILLVSALVSEGALYCQPNYCLMKIANGDDAASFTCEQYPDTAYVCDLEDGPDGCTCTGVVKYGNWERRHPPGSDTDDSPAKWTEPLCLNEGTVPCTSAQFGNVVNGAKVCTCEPTLDYAPMRGTHAAQSTDANGYVVPTCLIQKLSVNSTTSAAALWMYGVNAGGLGLIANLVFGPLGMNMAHHVILHEFDKDNLVATYQFNGLTSSVEATAATFDTYRSSAISNAVQSVFSDFADALGDSLASLALFQPSFLVHPRTFADIGVQCPSGYCVNQVRKGISSASFTCERYPQTEHICSYEDSPDNCICDGTVKYGNWGHVKVGSTTGEYVNETFTAGTAVTTSIQCNNAIFGNVVNGAKYCTCAPRISTSMSRSSKPALDATAGGVGYSTPTCLIATIGMRPTLSGVTIESLKPQGVDRGLVQFLLGNTIPALMDGDTLVTIGQEFNESTLMLTAQFQGGTTDVADGYSKTAATIESEKATQTNMKNILNSIIAADSSFAALGAVQPEWTFAYAPYPGGTYMPYNCTGEWYTTTTPTPEVEASYYRVSSGTCSSNGYSVIYSQSECLAAAQSLGLSIRQSDPEAKSETDGDPYPPGCTYHSVGNLENYVGITVDTISCDNDANRDCLCKSATTQGCDCITTITSMRLTSGDFGAEVEWQIEEDGELKCSGSDYSNNEIYSITNCCLRAGAYELLCLDTFGDGWNGASMTIVTSDSTNVYCADFDDGTDLIVPLNVAAPSNTSCQAPTSQASTTPATTSVSSTTLAETTKATTTSSQAYYYDSGTTSTWDAHASNSRDASTILRGQLRLRLARADDFVAEPNLMTPLREFIAEITVAPASWLHNVSARLLARRVLQQGEGTQADVDVKFSIVIPAGAPTSITAGVIVDRTDPEIVSEATAQFNAWINNGNVSRGYNVTVKWMHLEMDIQEQQAGNDESKDGKFPALVISLLALLVFFVLLLAAAILWCSRDRKAPMATQYNQRNTLPPPQRSSSKSSMEDFDLDLHVNSRPSMNSQTPLIALNDAAPGSLSQEHAIDAASPPFVNPYRSTESLGSLASSGTEASSPSTSPAQKRKSTRVSARVLRKSVTSLESDWTTAGSVPSRGLKKHAASNESDWTNAASVPAKGLKKHASRNKQATSHEINWAKSGSMPSTASVMTAPDKASRSRTAERKRFSTRSDLSTCGSQNSLTRSGTAGRKRPNPRKDIADSAPEKASLTSSTTAERKRLSPPSDAKDSTPEKASLADATTAERRRLGKVSHPKNKAARRKSTRSHDNAKPKALARRLSEPTVVGNAYDYESYPMM